MKINRRLFKPSFTMIELIIVIIIIGILAASLNFQFFNSNLQLAADKIANDLRYTESLAFKDDKYQPFPNHICDSSDEGKKECNRSKYWFKQWWQFRIAKTRSGDYWYEIFSDSPTASTSSNFDKRGGPSSEFAKSPLNNRYMTGNNGASTDEDLNLSKYNIALITYKIGDMEKTISSSSSLRILFDNYGNVFLDEGEKGDSGDINPLDYQKRPLLKKTLEIKLCQDSACNKCIGVFITPGAYVYEGKCK